MADRASSSSTRGSAPATPSGQLPLPSHTLATSATGDITLDNLEDQELAAFGLEASDDTLPPAPRDASGLVALAGGIAANAASAVVAPAQRAKGAGAAAGPLARAKRPKNVKFSPAKGGGKALARRSGGGKGEEQLPNNDFCDACQGKGHFLCCDGGCLRSFHFSCLEPPLELDEVPDESWFCKSCRAAKVPPPKPPRGFFRELIYKVDCENPKAFQLSPEIKTLYKNVATGANGEYIDSIEHRPPSKITGRAIGQEDRDPFRLKDKTGRAVICYNCNETASASKQRRIISCDFCEQHWHLDCLDPPMTGMPPPTRKWMCPVHSDHILPKKRVPKNTTLIDVSQPAVPNNGDIVVIPRKEARGAAGGTLEDERYEELTVNRIRYQVPEETVILDFWGRLQGGGLAVRGTPKKPSSRKMANSRSADTVGSPLTSLGELSDADPPEVAILGYSPYSKKNTVDLFPSAGSAYRSAPRAASEESSVPAYDTSALDSLALLAQGFQAGLEAANGTTSSSSNSINPPPVSGYAGRASTVGPSNLASRETDDDSLAPLASDKGKAKEVPPPNDRRASSSGAIRRPNELTPEEVMDHIDGPVQKRLRLMAPVAPMPGTTLVSEIPPYRPKEGEKAPEPPTQLSEQLEERLFAASAFAAERTFPKPIPNDLKVHSKEDLKALMHVRKLLAEAQAEAAKSSNGTDGGEGDGPDQQTIKETIFGFLEGQAIVPQLDYHKGDPGRTPWDLPWEDGTQGKHSYLVVEPPALDDDSMAED